MQESDSMLITTLKEFIAMPEHVTSLKDIRVEEIFLISISILEYLNVDTQEIKHLSTKSQRFRSMAKLNQTLYQEVQAQLELNQLMNPSVPFLRKLLLIFINKLASQESNDKNRNKNNSLRNKEGDNNHHKRDKNILKSWINEEWIHPSLCEGKCKYKGYIVPLTINKNILKNNINLGHQLSNNPHLRGNIPIILSSTIAKHQLRVKQFQENQGIARKEHEEQVISVQTLVKNNRNDWKISQAKIKKIKKKVVVEQAENVSEIMPQEITSVFKKQVQEIAITTPKKQEGQKSIQTTNKEENLTYENPLERMKKQIENKNKDYELQIKQILQQLKNKKEVIETEETLKKEIEQKIQNDEEKTVKLKVETVELKKTVEKKQNLLTTLEGSKDINQEITKLEEEIKLIQNQAGEEIKNIEKEIKEMSAESKQKIEGLQDIKLKLNKIENDYSKIREEIKEKEELKGNVKIMKSGVNRQYYSKKIGEIEVRWRETQKQLVKNKKTLQELKEKNRIQLSLNERIETEIENVLNMDKSKGEAENKVLKEMFAKCLDTFKVTLKTLEEINQVKSQTQEFQMKVHALSGKNYKQNMEKINFALEDLKKEILDINNSKSKLK